MKDYYKILGVDKSASEGEIKTAYRNLAKKYHPDVNPNNDAAQEKFKEVSEAYEILGNGDKRGKYDRGEMDTDQFGGAGGFNGQGFSGAGFEDIFDMFSNFMGGSSRSQGQATATGSDITYNVNLTFMEAALGVTRELSFARLEKCSSCNGTGAKDSSSFKVCDKCKGSGRATVVRDTIFGRQVTQTTCDKCGGSGKIITDSCKDCNGKGVVNKKKIINVKVPAGVDNGMVMTLENEGNASRAYNGRSGNLQLVFNVENSKVFKRDDLNLFVEVPITYLTAALGGEIEVPTLEGVMVHKLTDAIGNNETIRFRGKGIKSSRNGRVGDLFVKVIVEVPKGISKKARTALENFDREMSLKNSPKRSEFLTNIQDLYKK